MSEYISREELLKKEKHQEDWNMFLDYVTIDDVKSIPSADVRENIHGHWIEKEGSIYVCSKCEGAELFEAKFCHTCGAIMDGKTEHLCPEDDNDD